MLANPEAEPFRELYNAFLPHIYADWPQVDSRCPVVTLPLVPLPLLAALCDAVIAILTTEPMLLEIGTSTTVVGDLHGHLPDLFRILGKMGLPPARTYLFLGDLVDRGEFSTETVIVLFLLKVIFPRFIYFIRGNHEFAQLAQQDGFSAEIHSIYGSPVAEEHILEAFSYMPIAAVICKSALCVHGGVGPSVSSLSQVAAIPRPLTGFDSEPVKELLWSDPTAAAPGFEPSPRGIGCLFGADALAAFLDAHALRCMVRGHECVPEGVAMQHRRRLFTVFSASNYCGLEANKAGVLLVKADGGCEAFFFQPLCYIRRADVGFARPVEDGQQRAARAKVPARKPNIKHPSVRSAVSYAGPLARRGGEWASPVKFGGVGRQGV
jgi:protein phosphatase